MQTTQLTNLVEYKGGKSHDTNGDRPSWKQRKKL